MSKAFRFRHCGFRRAIHRKHQVVGLLPHAREPQRAFDALQCRRQRDFDFGISEETVLGPEFRNRGGGAVRERLLKASVCLAMGDAGEIRSCRADGKG